MLQVRTFVRACLRLSAPDSWRIWRDCREQQRPADTTAVRRVPSRPLEVDNTRAARNHFETSASIPFRPFRSSRSSQRPALIRSIKA